MRRLIVFIISIIIALPGVAAAQTNTAITPVVSVTPPLFPAGQRSSFFISVTNGNPASTASILPNESFSFTFGPASGTGIALESLLLVNSVSFNAWDFAVAMSASNQIVITYQGTAKQFRPGESFSIKLSFNAPSSIGSGRIIALGPPPKPSRYNETIPSITTISFVDFATGPQGLRNCSRITWPFREEAFKNGRNLRVFEAKRPTYF